MRNKNFFLFFHLPFVGIVLLFFLFSSLNRSYIRRKVENLVREQLQATADILKVSIPHFLEEDYSAEDIFALYAEEENIYYMALLDEKRSLLGWSSRFEGYLPLSLRTTAPDATWIIDSPAGKIFNFFSAFGAGGGRTYFLYLGYSLNNLEDMIAHSRRNFIIFFGLLSAAGVFFFIGLFQMQTRYLGKVRELSRQRQEKRRYQEISAFTSGVAHEIKNPLNRLSLLFDLLEKNVPEASRTDARSGKEEVKKISQIIDHFSSAIRPLKLNKTEFILPETVLEIRDSLLRELDDSQGIVNFSQKGTIAMHADKTLMSRALYNLIRNALEAAPGGEVTVNAERHRKQIHITVRDCGPGLSQEDLSRIFDPFYSRKAGGMGIGLYLTKKIIEAHDGTITCTSDPGDGMEFFITLPSGD